MKTSKTANDFQRPYGLLYSRFNSLPLLMGALCTYNITRMHHGDDKKKRMKSSFLYCVPRYNATTESL